MDLEDKAINNPLVRISIEDTIQLLRDYIASEPLGQAIIRFQKKNPQVYKWDSSERGNQIWKIICKKAAEKIMEEIHKLVGDDLAKLDDHVVDQAINKVLSVANSKIKIHESDAILFTITDKNLPPEHPLRSNKKVGHEKFNLFGDNKTIPDNN